MDFGEYDEKVNQLNDVTKDYMEKAQAKKDEAIEKLKGLGETYETIAGGILGGSTIFNEVTGGNHGLYTLTKKIGGNIMKKGVKQTAQDLFQNTKTSVQNFLGNNPTIKAMTDEDLQSTHQLATNNLTKAQAIADNEALPSATREAAKNSVEKLKPIQKNLTNELENRNIAKRFPDLQDENLAQQPQEIQDGAIAQARQDYQRRYNQLTDDQRAAVDQRIEDEPDTIENPQTLDDYKTNLKKMNDIVDDETGTAGADEATAAGAAGADEATAAGATGLSEGLAGEGLGEAVGAGLDATGILAPIGLAIQIGSVLGTAIEGLEDLFGANKKSDEAPPPPPKLAQVQYSPNV